MSTRALRGLRTQLLLWTILPVTLLLVALVVANVASHRRAMQQLVEDRDRSLVLVEAARLSRQLDTLRTTIVDVASDPSLHGEQALAVETAARRSQELTSGLVLQEGPGKVLYASSGSEMWRDQPTVCTLVSQAQSSGSSVIGTMAPAGRMPLLVVVAPVPQAMMAGQTGQAPVQSQRFVLSAFPIERLDLASASDVVRASRRGVTYLLSDSGQVLHHADPAQLNLPPPDLDALPAPEFGQAGVTNFRRGSEHLVATYAQVPPVNWTLVLEEPLSDLSPPLLRSVDALPLLLLFITVVTLLALYFAVRWVIWPLQELDRQAARMAWGDFDAVSQPVGGVQEIEDLRQTLTQMAERVQTYQAGMRDYLAAVTHAQEEERKRLARELHDDTAQSLIGMRQRVELLEKALARDPNQASQRLEDLRKLIDDTLAGVRGFSRDLRPIYLEDLGFLPALEALASDVEARHGIEVGFSVSGNTRRLPADMELAAFRIVQEGLNNAVRHAHAARVDLAVEFADDGLTLRLEDDGVGFVPPEQPAELAANGHFGLMGIHERVLLHGGHLVIKSAPDRGTTLIAWLPDPETRQTA